MKVKIYTIKDLDTGRMYSYRDKKAMQKDLPQFTNCQIIEDYINECFYIEIGLINEKGQSFEKGFDSLKEAKAFLNKTVRGSKLTIESIFSFSDEALKELDYVCNLQRINRSR